MLISYTVCYTQLIMKTKNFISKNGWDAESLDTMINEWLEGVNIEIIDVKYGCTSQIEKYRHGEQTVIRQTALFIYKEVN